MLINSLYTFATGFLFLYLLIAVKSHKILPELQSHPNWKLLDRGEECGYSSSDRIIGGIKARLGQYPWIARLGYNISPEGEVQYNCAGTIINNRYILTATHCSPTVHSIPIVHVRLGEYDATTDIDCQDGVCAPPVQDIAVEKITCHDSYEVNIYHHDICLIRLAEQIKFNKYVFPICLPAYDFFESNQFEGTIMEVAGWGVTNIVTFEKSDILLTLKVPVVSHSSCVSSYAESNMPIKDTQICAGGVIGKDSCGGDSGGPLMSAISLDGPPRYFLVGIVSFGSQKCANSTYPGIYTNVFQYIKWILQIVRE